MAKRRIGIVIDMTPMVDVAFLLLIFFMTTNSFKPPEQVGVTLPGSKSEIHVPETNTIVLTVNKAGETFISNENLSQTMQVDKADLVKAILTWRAKNPAAVVVVKGDKDVDYGGVAVSSVSPVAAAASRVVTPRSSEFDAWSRKRIRWDELLNGVGLQ